MKTKQSKSMMCHYYDKLLHIAATYIKDPESVANDWIVKEAISRVEPLENICLLYGNKGEVPEELIKSYMKKEDLVAVEKKEQSSGESSSDSEMTEDKALPEMLDVGSVEESSEEDLDIQKILAKLPAKKPETETVFSED